MRSLFARPFESYGTYHHLLAKRSRGDVRYAICLCLKSTWVKTFANHAQIKLASLK